MPSATSDPSAAARKRRSDSEAAGNPATTANPSLEGDHRKKRRNRTTQSCLNCHTSKRMCDRRRPACARCTQLGLTGLCVYEVDDPNQRADEGETARLITRVAELEGVIREMKNKPNPRWLQPSGNHPSDVTPDKWGHRSHHHGVSSDMDSISYSQSRSCSPSTSTSDASQSDRSPFLRPRHRPSRSSGIMTSVNAYANAAVDPTPQGHSPFGQSPQSSPSPLVSTPEEYARPQVTISSGLPQDYNLAAMLLSYPPHFAPHDEYTGIPKESMDGYPHLVQQEQVYCGCAEESSTYGVLLEVSLRLRKAADMMARNSSHQHSGNCCPLYRQVSDLDRYLSNLLGNVAPLAPVSESNIPSSYGNMNQPTYGPPYPSHHEAHQMSPVSPSLVSGVQSWDMSGQHRAPPPPQIRPEESYTRWHPLAT
ncbi:hypothetical protein D9611_003821 [Ephemerocybe angulata]|uniref:Zn(2)-C6 fungal-type domain-containing protein n=1 Tax=Ephemerocybe angulata TaxID=980116 RepID=A0A8H5B7I7_9AGAR|nr:hypothetical protein D9611_003821 [Tulosesus angulatus]